MKLLHFSILTWMIGWYGSAAVGQGVPEYLRPIERGVADTSVLGESFRQIDLGLRIPDGFGQVYEVVGHPDILVSASGAIYAAFPQATYAKYRGRDIATVPPDTIFYIGAPPEWQDAASNLDPPRSLSILASSGRIDTRVRSAVHSQVSESPVASDETVPSSPQVEPESRSSTLPSIVSDPVYRATRWAELLSEACGSGG